MSSAIRELWILDRELQRAPTTSIESNKTTCRVRKECYMATVIGDEIVRAHSFRQQ